MSAGIEGISPAVYYDRKYYLGVLNGKLAREEFRHFVSPPYVVKAYRRFIRGVSETFNVFEYLRPSLKDIYQTIEDELGWKNPGRQIEHGDCLLDPVKNYLMYKKWGCSEITGIYATLVRNGQMAREEALKKAVAEEQAETPAILPDFLKAIGMTQVQFDDAISKDFRDIPNLQANAFFQCCKKIVNNLTRIRGWR